MVEGTILIRRICIEQHSDLKKERRNGSFSDASEFPAAVNDEMDHYGAGSPRSLPLNARPGPLPPVPLPLLPEEERDVGGGGAEEEGRGLAAGVPHRGAIALPSSSSSTPFFLPFLGYHRNSSEVTGRNPNRSLLLGARERENMSRGRVWAGAETDKTAVFMGGDCVPEREHFRWPRNSWKNICRRSPESFPFRVSPSSWIVILFFFPGRTSKPDAFLILFERGSSAAAAAEDDCRF